MDETSQTNMMQQPKFAGFWIRLWAKLLELLIFAPFILGANWLAAKNQMTPFTLVVPEATLFYLYNLILLARSGQTLGKRIAHIKVIALDGSDAGWRRSFLRSLDDLVQTIPVCAVQMLTINAIPSAQYLDLTSRERYKGTQICTA